MSYEKKIVEKVEVTTTGDVPPVVHPVLAGQHIVTGTSPIPVTSSVTCTTACPPGVHEHHHDHHHHHHGSETICETAEHSTHRTHTEVRAPLITPAAPIVSTSVSGLAQDIVSEGFTASAARVSAESSHELVVETDEMRRKAAADRERYEREQAAIEKQYEHNLEKKTEKYRKEAEEQAEKIRKEMEKQHHKDVEFRKELVEAAIDKQKKEIEVEAKLARKELELERQKAIEALERSKMSTNIEVKFDAAAGKTVSEGVVVSEHVDVSHPRM
uniref:CAHS 4a n=1 Tax=Macrobiotus sp. 1 JF-2022a TaxID=3003599 RepID=A0AAE9W552_9BILA|nr:CAHS 4a [Macrobiotus sp. 1 JF-2022a]